MPLICCKTPRQSPEMECLATDGDSLGQLVNAMASFVCCVGSSEDGESLNSFSGISFSS